MGKAPPKKNPDKTWTSVWMPLALKRKLRLHAAQHETSMNQAVVDILTRELG